MTFSTRLSRYVERVFDEPGSARAIEDLVVNAVRSIEGVEDWAPEHLERLYAAVVFGGGDSVDGVIDMCSLAKTDWRDALVGGGLGDGDWPAQLDARLGTSS